MAAAADEVTPTHFACYCPLSDDCSSKGRIGGWRESADAAKEKLYNHLISSTYHQLDEDAAVAAVQRSQMDTWAPGKKTLANKRPADSQPQDDRGSKGKGSKGKGASSSSSSSADRGQEVAYWKKRAEEAEEQLGFLNGVMTRVVENLTRSAASCKTAGRFARQASEAFDHEHHNIALSLETIQQLYAPSAGQQLTHQLTL
jgi:hypothetical protein